MTHATLEDFVAAQDRVWPAVETELAAGAKTTHWIWFVFPQLAGLGRSPTARFYELRSIAEARAYLAEPTLGPRLLRAVELMLTHRSRGAEAVLGPVDALKFRSCLTLFAAAAPEEPLFGTALAALYPGPDPITLALLGRGPLS